MRELRAEQSACLSGAFHIVVMLHGTRRCAPKPCATPRVKLFVRHIIAVEVGPVLANFHSYSPTAHHAPEVRAYHALGMRSLIHCKQMLRLLRCRAALGVAVASCATLLRSAGCETPHADHELRYPRRALTLTYPITLNREAIKITQLPLLCPLIRPQNTLPPNIFALQNFTALEIRSPSGPCHRCCPYAILHTTHFAC